VDTKKNQKQDYINTEEDILKNRTNKKLTAPKDKKKLRQKIDYRNYQSEDLEEDEERF
jgi:hypothetical protein